MIKRQLDGLERADQLMSEKQELLLEGSHAVHSDDLL